MITHKVQEVNHTVENTTSLEYYKPMAALAVYKNRYIKYYILPYLAAALASHKTNNTNENTQVKKLRKERVNLII